jgi:polysaccharide export outer membrane protein
MGAAGDEARPTRNYVLGADDEFVVTAINLPELDGKKFQVGRDGFAQMPLAGKVRVAGRTVRDFEGALGAVLQRYLLNPQVAVSVTEYRSQPVSVLGAVNAPGTYQAHGGRPLVEVLSSAGGLKSSAGGKVVLVRLKDNGAIPLPGAHWDASGEYNVAEISTRTLLNATTPQTNILVLAHDTVTVPEAQVVYVLGAVRKPGGFPLSETGTISILQALSLAGGTDATAALSDARILRSSPSAAGGKAEIPINVKRLLSGRDAVDTQMKAEDILFVPTSTTKKVSLRSIEAMIQLGTGVLIWRR